MSPLELLGILSALLALVAFVGNQYGRMKNDSFVYDFLNFLSGAGLVYYALTIHAVPFMITNSVWAVVSGIDVLKYIFRRHKKVSKR